MGVIDNNLAIMPKLNFDNIGDDAENPITQSKISKKKRKA